MFKPSKLKIISILLLFCSNTAWSFPACVFDKFNLKPDDVFLSYNSIRGALFIEYRGNSTPMIAAVDKNCNLLYQRKLDSSAISIFELDDTSGLVFMTIFGGGNMADTYAVDAYLTKPDPITGKMTVKPALLDLYASPVSPQFDIGDTSPPNIIACDNTNYGGLTDACHIYSYDGKKEKYTKVRSHLCKKPCDFLKSYAKIIHGDQSNVKSRH